MWSWHWFWLYGPLGNVVTCLWMAPLGPPAGYRRTHMHPHLVGASRTPEEAWAWHILPSLHRGSLGTQLGLLFLQHRPGPPTSLSKMGLSSVVRTPACGPGGGS